MSGPGGGKGRASKSPQVVPSFRFHKEGDHAEISEILETEQGSVFNMGEDLRILKMFCTLSLLFKPNLSFSLNDFYIQ